MHGRKKGRPTDGAHVGGELVGVVQVVEHVVEHMAQEVHVLVQGRRRSLLV